MDDIRDKDLERLKHLKDLGDGTAVGTVNDIKNINSDVWLIFKKISRLLGNSEGAALSACVMAFIAVPSNKKTLDENTNKEMVDKQ